MEIGRTTFTSNQSYVDNEKKKKSDVSAFDARDELIRTCSNSIAKISEINVRRNNVEEYFISNYRISS